MKSSDTIYQISISGSHEHLEKTRKLVHFISRQFGMDEQDSDIIELAVAEACHNALLHMEDKEGPASFQLKLYLNQDAIKAVVLDSGEEFEFSGIEPFSIEKDFLKYKNGGLGIPLIKALMDEVDYKRIHNKTNQITLIKYFSPRLKKRRKLSR